MPISEDDRSRLVVDPLGLLCLRENLDPVLLHETYCAINLQVGSVVVKKNQDHAQGLYTDR